MTNQQFEQEVREKTFPSLCIIFFSLTIYTIVFLITHHLRQGRNSVLYRDEIQRILGSVRSQIEVGTPCAFITRPSDSGKDKGPSFLFESTGFDVLGQAFVPQRNFLLPASKKKKNSGIGNSGSTKDNRNQCVITVALAK